MTSGKRLTLLAATIMLALAGAALSAGSALAQSYSWTYYDDGPSVPAGTTYTAAGSLDFTNSTGTSVYMRCKNVTLGGATGSGTQGAQLDVSGASFSGCIMAGVSITWTANFPDTYWYVIPTGTASPFTIEINDVSLTLSCGGGSSATFTGNLTSGAVYTDSYPSSITLTNASSLSKTSTTGTGCPVIPSTFYLIGTFPLTEVGGLPVSATNNLWLNDTP